MKRTQKMPDQRWFSSMNLYVIHDGRFYQDGEGNIWTACSADHSFWARYLSSFDRVHIVARLKKVAHEVRSPELKIVSKSKSISVVPLPYFEGAKAYLLNLLSVRRALKQVIGGLTEKDRVIVRSPLSIFIPRDLYKKKYAVEVVGDSFASLYSGKAISFLYAWLYAKHQRSLVKNAQFCSYVTSKTLQEKYPSNFRAFSTYYSSINLTDEDYCQLTVDELVEKYRSRQRVGRPWRLVSVGSLEFGYKGADILLGALRELIYRGYPVSLIWIGGGKKLNEYVQLARNLGVLNQVQFVGRQPFSEVKDQLRRADVFVLASRSEGLPRSMIEAMASSLVCVGTDSGGTKELVADECLAKPRSISSLLEVLEHVFSLDAHELARLASINYRESTNYRADLIARRRVRFYEEIKRVKP